MLHIVLLLVTQSMSSSVRNSGGHKVAFETSGRKISMAERNRKVLKGKMFPLKVTECTLLCMVLLNATQSEREALVVMMLHLSHV